MLSCKVATDAGGASKGYGFVQFEREADATAAVRAMNGAVLCGRELAVGPFVPRVERTAPAGKLGNVYVKQLADSVTEDTLEEVFGQVCDSTRPVCQRHSWWHQCLQE